MAEEREILLKVEVDKSQAQSELEDVTAQLLENKKAVTELNTAYKQGTVSTDAYVKESIKLKSEQKALTEQEKQLTKEVNAEVNSLNALRNRLASLTRERNAINQGTKEGAKRFNELQKEIAETTEKIKAQEQAGGDFRRNVGNYGSAFKEAVGGVQVFGTSLDGLFKLIIANPIGLIITALALLFKSFSQNDTIATAFKGVMTGLGIVLDNITAVISSVAIGFGEFFESSSTATNFIKDVAIRVLNNLLAPLNFILDILPAVSAALEGEFEKAANIAGDATLKFGKSVAFMNDEMPEFVQNIGDAVSAGIEYEKTLDEIEAKQSKLNVSTAELQNQRDRLILQSKDLSKSEEERIKLNERAVEIDKKILSERLKLLDEEISAEKNHIKELGNDSVKREAAEFRLNDLLVKRLDFENEALRFEEIAQNKRNAIIEKRIGNEEKLKEAAKKKAEEEEKARQKALEEEEKIAEIRKKSKQDLEQFKLQEEINASKESLDNEELTGEERISILSDILEKEKQKEIDKRNFLLENDALTVEERKLIYAQYQSEIRDLEKETQEAIREENKKTEQLKEEQIVNGLNIAKNVANQLAGIAEDGSDAQKILASAAALINTYQGVTGALANSAPPPVGLGPVGAFVTAGGILATGLANVAKINAAAGGGDFVTTKPTLLLVGDNPGARERVTVTPLSGKGKTMVNPNSGLIAMAGGGSLTSIGASLTNTRSIDDSVNTSSLLSAFQNMPTPVVSVKEISNVSDRVKVKETVKTL